MIELGSLSLIDDAYNANPISMQLGLDTLDEVAASGIPESMPRRRIAILGMMAELGPEAARYHAAIGEYARLRADLIIGVGELATHYAPDHWFPTHVACNDALPGLLRSNDCVLVKGSHSVGLRHIVRRMTRPTGDGAE